MFNDKLEKKIQELRVKFLNEAPQKITLIENHWRQVLATPIEDHFKTLHFEIHSFMGSSATLGFQKLADHLKQMDLLIKIALNSGKLNDEVRASFAQLLEPLVKSKPSQDSPLLKQKSDSSNSAPHKTAETQDTTTQLSIVDDRIISQPTNKIHVSDMRIVLVDDDRAVSQMMIKLLNDFGFKTDHFFSIEHLKADNNPKKPDLVLLDLVMPDVDEIEVFRFAKNLEKKKIPIFILSSTASFSARLQAVRANVSGYLVKPVAISVLITKIRQILKLDMIRPFKVLLLDDQPDVTTYFQALLEQQEAEVLVLNKADNLLVELESFAPDIFLLDFHMPNISGLEVAKVIRQYDKYDYIPIVFITSENTIQAKVDILEVGSEDIIAKDTPPEIITKQIISRVIRGQNIRVLATRDSLTGVLNHGQIMDAASHTFQLAKRRKSPMTICMLDLDHFKKVNDTYGHSAGDKVLIALCQMLLQALRQTDYVGRYGGEEFILAFPDADATMVCKKLDEFRETFSQVEFKSGATTFHVTLSGGLASSSDYDQLTDLISAADKALYRAKAQGRNQICNASAEEE